MQASIGATEINLFTKITLNVQKVKVYSNVAEKALEGIYMAAEFLNLNSIVNSAETSIRESAKTERNDLRTQVQKQVEDSVEFQVLTKVIANKELSTKVVKSVDETSSQNLETSPQQFSDTYETISKEISMEIKTETATSEQREFSVSIKRQRGELSVKTEDVTIADPLAFDMDNNGFKTTGVENGVEFDINGDGVIDKTSFITGNDRFLALDKNYNGKIDDGTELFGDQNGAENGFEELKKYDSNNDGVIDSNDPVFERLRLFGFDQESSSMVSEKVSDSLIKSIALGYREGVKALNAYDTVKQSSEVTSNEGESISSADIDLGFYKSV